MRLVQSYAQSMWPHIQSAGLVLVHMAPLQIKKKDASSSRHFTALQIRKTYSRN